MYSIARLTIFFRNEATFSLVPGAEEECLVHTVGFPVNLNEPHTSLFNCNFCSIAFRKSR